LNILFYYTDKERAVSLSSLMIAFQKQGHQVYLLTHSAEGPLHQQVKVYGVKTFSHVIQKTSFLFYLRHLLHLLKFISKNRCDIVYSHIQQANIIACFAQYFTYARVILCRHHSDYVYKGNSFNPKLFDRIINLFGKEFVVPSKKVFNQMVNVEKVRPDRIHLIPYAYNFAEYPKADYNIVNELKLAYPCKLSLLTIARLISEKRHIILFQAINYLVNKGYDIKLIILGDGGERQDLGNYIKENKLQENIFMLGFRTDIMNFIAACDISVLLSESEASNSFIKESALQCKTAIVCDDVGDFNEYIKHNENGFLINKVNPQPELEKLLEDIYSGKTNIHGLGEKLYKSMIQLFSIESIIREYDSLNSQK
jgi:L-malate glycosyltransferase